MCIQALALTIKTCTMNFTRGLTTHIAGTHAIVMIVMVGISTAIDVINTAMITTTIIDTHVIATTIAMIAATCQIIPHWMRVRDQ